MSGTTYRPIPPKTVYAPIWWQLLVLLVLACIYVGVFVVVMRISAVVLVLVVIAYFPLDMRGVFESLHRLIRYIESSIVFLCTEPDVEAWDMDIFDVLTGTGQTN